MKTFADYLNDVKYGKRVKQKELAAIMGVSEGAISSYLKGTEVPKDLACLKLAEFTGDDPAKIFLLAAESRANENAKPVWEKIKKASGFSVVAFLMFASMANASTSSSAKCVFQNDVLSIMRHPKTHRRRRPRLMFLPA